MDVPAHKWVTCFIQYVLFVAYLRVSVMADICMYQNCSCYGTQIMCQVKGLTEIPPITGPVPDKAYLMFDTNNITRIPAGILPPRIEYFTAFDNPLISIDDNAFNESASTLATFHISNFLFTRFPNALLQLNTLEYITMYDATILDWNEDVMKHIGPTMLTLDLQNISLYSWPNWLQYFPNLIVLSLDTGTISNVPDDALNMLANSLTTLVITNNNLLSVPKTISNMKALQSLQLNNNNIIDISWLPVSSKLTSLSLYSNRIYDSNQLSTSLRPYADSLEEFSILRNNLKIIPDLSFLKLLSLDFTNNQISDANNGHLSTGINYLDLSFNSLSRIPLIVLSLPNVIELRLSNNMVTAIHATEFSPYLIMADLSSNLISELTDTSFPINSNLTTLYLMNNPIAKISSLVFENLRQLTMLNMKNTKLTRLPLELSLLVNVNYFEIDGSSDLICTCSEKNLATWILTRPNQPDGKCGVANIREFFATLSPDCP